MFDDIIYNINNVVVFHTDTKGKQLNQIMFKSVHQLWSYGLDKYTPNARMHGRNNELVNRRTITQTKS